MISLAILSRPALSCSCRAIPWILALDTYGMRAIDQSLWPSSTQPILQELTHDSPFGAPLLAERSPDDLYKNSQARNNSTNHIGGVDGIRKCSGYALDSKLIRR